MRILLLLPTLLTIHFFVSAQQGLSGSRRSSALVYAWRLDPTEARELFGTNLKNWERYTGAAPADSFAVELRDTPPLPPGTWLLLQAAGSRLSASLRTVGPVRYDILNNGKTTALILYSPEGQAITGADVFIRRRKTPYHPVSNSYALGHWKGDRPIAVVYEGETLYFTVNGARPRPMRLQQDPTHDQRPYESRFHSYFVCSKPKYKPGDTVSGKAFIMNARGRPLLRPLALHLGRQYGGNDTLLAVVSPYRPGGYSFSFVLTDSLHLRLDANYSLSLQEMKPAKEDQEDASRKPLSQISFAYEEYDLKAIRLKVRADRMDNSPGIPLSLFLQALDENDLPVPDGRVRIQVLPGFIGDKFHRQELFIPDTLWQWTQVLDPVGETRIILPDSIFPAASFSYRVHCTLLNSDNESDNQQLYFSWSDDMARVVFRKEDDSLHIACLLRGQSKQVKATLQAFTRKGDQLPAKTLSLPTSLRINPYVYQYVIHTAFEGDSIQGVQYFGGGAQPVSCISSRIRDSVSIEVDNPLHLSFWYTITAGRRLIRQGYGDSLRYFARASAGPLYTVTLQYMQWGQLQKQKHYIPYEDKILHLDIRQEAYVYPGQRADVEVGVKDAKGRPVAGADLTAWSYTAKFATPPPAVPYLGRAYSLPKTYAYKLPGNAGRTQTDTPLDWRAWGKRLALDTIAYYQFLNPASLYISREPTSSGTTELAPFVSRKGQPEEAVLIYIDEELVYFNQTEAVKRYSFQVSPGKHYLRLRVADREIEADSIITPRGEKTIIGINDDTANKAVRVVPRPDTLTTGEKELLQHSLLLVRNSFGNHYTTISQGPGRLYLLAPSGQYAPASDLFLAGPFTGQNAQMEVRDEFTQSFEPETGFEFIIRQGLIREKEWPYHYPFATTLRHNAPEPPLTDRALTRQTVDSLWEDYLDNRSATQDLYNKDRYTQHGSGRLRTGGLADTGSRKVFVKSIFLFRYDDADLLHVYKGIDRDLGTQEPGLYRLFLLLKGGRYILRDSVLIRPNGLSWYDLGRLPVQPADTFSQHLSAILRRLNLESMDAPFPPPDSLKFLFNDRYLDLGRWSNEVTGLITNEKGEPIVGATVMIRATRHGTVTDFRGRFHLKVPARGLLQISNIGYNTVTRRLSPGENYEIRIQPVSSSLSDVVVIGYGVERKKDLTGSVAYMVLGKAAGVQVGNSKLPAPGLPATDSSLFAFPSMPGLDTLHSFRSRFRDDAYWQPRLRTDENGKASFSVQYPDDITRWTTFVIAATDHRQTGIAIGSVRAAKPLSARLSLPAFLLAGDSARVIGKLLNYLPDTMKVKRRFTINDSLAANRSVSLRAAWIDTFALQPHTTDSLRLNYTLERADGYFDGEERKVPVYPVGVQEIHGHFAALEGDTVVNWSFDPAKGPVHVHADASLLPVMLEEIEHIGRYEYLCNEQLASKLMALLEKKATYRLLQKEFKEEKNIRQIIDQLAKGRRGGALWGWWPEGEGVAWISLHVTEALLAAEKEGYPIQLDKATLTSYLVWSLEKGSLMDRLLELRMLEELHAKTDYQRYIDTLETHFDHKNLYLTLRLQELRQGAGLPTRLDTLVSRRQYTALGNCYWGEDIPLFFDNAIQNTLLMYRLLRAEGGYDALLRKARDYLLEKRGGGHWRSTYESGLVLRTLLPDLLTAKGSLPAPSLTVNSTPVTSFPYDAQATPGAPLRASEKGPLPVYFTAYQQAWNASPEKVEGAFAVQSEFKRNGQLLESLTAGEIVTLQVEVLVKGDADYVLVEIPIPAGCTYSEKSQGDWNTESHREYFKNKLSIFCQSLIKGRHVFTVELMPRYSGRYQLNPARAELLYFPVFYGREEEKRIRID